MKNPNKINFTPLAILSLFTALAIAYALHRPVDKYSVTEKPKSSYIIMHVVPGPTTNDAVNYRQLVDTIILDSSLLNHSQIQP